MLAIGGNIDAGEVHEGDGLLRGAKGVGDKTGAEPRE